jgi:hypothetical protein
MTHELGPPITPDDALLHRQVHPSFIDDGQPTSQAFRPTPKDSGLLSVSDGSKTTAESAYKLHVYQRDLRSFGVWSVTVAESGAAGLKAFSDPLSTPVPDPAHAVIDFQGLSSGKVEAQSKRLKRDAVARGCQYRPG